MNSTQVEKNTLFIKNTAKTLGFDYCGISKVEFLEKEAPLLEKWLSQNMHGKMSYMENHFDMRLNPAQIVPGAKSIISLLINYAPSQTLFTKSKFKISSYAYGEDYHHVAKKMLKSFLQELKTEIGEIDGRAFIDSAPIMDKVWAQKSGLGWMGKHTNLINKQSGSYFFIAELILDLELLPDSPTKDYCGTCTKCIDACPTDAITQAYTVDGSKCISYLTIELKENIPLEFKNKMESWVFGCDICQEVCPWNRFAKPHHNASLAPSAEFLSLNDKDMEEITQETFDKVFKKSALKRTKYEGLARNLAFAKRS